jgi:hypothetical protein
MDIFQCELISYDDIWSLEVVHVQWVTLLFEIDIYNILKYIFTLQVNNIQFMFIIYFRDEIYTSQT